MIHKRLAAIESLERRSMMSAATAVPGDATGDGAVNAQDLALVASEWLQTGSDLPADMLHNGIVNAQDIALVASNWGQTAVTINNPELQLDATDSGSLVLTGAPGQQTVSSWTAKGSLTDTFTVSPASNGAPAFIPQSNMNGQPAVSFTGVSAGPTGSMQALKYAGAALPNETSGDVYIVAEFKGPTDVERLDTLFSSASDTTAFDYQFFALYSNVWGTAPDQGAGQSLARIRWRDDGLQDDVRGELTQLQSNVPYVFHFCGNGLGSNAYGMSINGLDQGPPLYHTYNGGYDGSWFGSIANRTNMTIGDFERSDGPQGGFNGLISEIDDFAGTAAQPTLPSGQSAAIVDYLMQKYGATRLGLDE
jgi:hypothetical protein